jgi:ABC-type thiamin/hydroxymethylpyrimidine transport system permease subunit
MRRYYFSTKDLVTIALLSALGGVLSAYIGYLGNLVNHIFGVPFGAGQFMAGLHVIWIMLALAITGKKGAATTTGVLKGVVELFMGGTHGIVIIVVSAVQGLIPDLVLFRDRSKHERNIISFSIAGGLASASNVIVFQSFFFSGVPAVLILLLCMLAFASGIIFGGWFTLEMLSSLELSGVISGIRGRFVDVPESDQKPVPAPLRRRNLRRRTGVVAMTVLLAAFTVGGVYYFTFIFELHGDEIDVSGCLDNPYEFRYADFDDREVTIEAELVGSVIYVEPRDYSGIPLNIIIQEGQPQASATEVVVTASDGYHAVFSFDSVMTDDTIIIIEEDSTFRLIAAEYEGAYWVRLVTDIEVR